MSNENTFLAVFTGNKTGTRFKEWETMPEATRNTKMKEGIAAWKGWMEKNSASVVVMGGPLGKTKKISPSGIEDISNLLTGFVVVKAGSPDAAAKMFERHPHFTIFPGEAVEVMPVLPIPAG